MNERTFGIRLRSARRNANMSQTELAAMSGIRKSALSRYENDHILPSLNSLGRLAAALKIDRTELLPGEPSGVEALCDELAARRVTLSPADAVWLADAIVEALRLHRDGLAVEETAG